jgi:trehalose-6-phosphate synthase
MGVRALPQTTSSLLQRSIQRLVVVSNRLPVAAVRAKDGAWSLLPGSGGLVTALAPVLEARGGLWVGWPGLIGEMDHEVGPLLESFARRQGYGLVPVSLTKAEHDLFYLGFANEVLWPLFHDLQSRCTFVPEYWQAFLDVNRRFAAASCAAMQPGDMVWVHDYLLLGVGRFARELIPEARLGFFLHIPFPPPDIFAKLPWRTEVLRALLAYDLVGFQTVRDRRNFVACLRALLPEAVVRGRGNARLALIQILVPSRSEIPEYVQQKAEVERLVGEINGELGQPGWTPIHYFCRSVDREELVAYYRAASVCLATPLKDGMNLVAKEYCACQAERRGVLVLSEFAGAAVQLADGALLVNPYDILGVAAAIARACEMPTEERKRRMARLQRNVLAEDVHCWVDDFLSHGQGD